MIGRIEFKNVTAFARGTLCVLLADAYSFNSKYAKHFYKDWLEFDDFFFDNPTIADKYGFITTLDDKAIGFASWNPRNMPEYAIYGFNCITGAYKGNGYGKAQLAHAVDIIFRAGAQSIIVTTNSDLIPAQRMYEAVGFKLHQKRINKDFDGFFKEYFDYVLEKGDEIISSACLR